MVEYTEETMAKNTKRTILKKPFGRKKGFRKRKDMDVFDEAMAMSNTLIKNSETGNLELDLTEKGLANMRKALDIVNKKQLTFADEVMAALSVPDKLLSGFRKGEKRAYQIVKNMKQEFFRAKRFVVTEDLNKYIFDNAAYPTSVNRICLVLIICL